MDKGRYQCDGMLIDEVEGLYKRFKSIKSGQKLSHLLGIKRQTGGIGHFHQTRRINLSLRRLLSEVFCPKFFFPKFDL